MDKRTLARAVKAFLCLSAMGVAAVAAVTRPATADVAAPTETLPGFDMWCLEIALLPQVRCDARRAEDVKSYEQYRARTERFESEREKRQRQEEALRQRLKRDPTAKIDRGLAGPQ